MRCADAPCKSCPYRQDVPSGVWDESEYAKLERFDGPTFEQDPKVFMCHQQDGKLCAGWAGCHDMAESFGARVAVLNGMLDEDDYNALLDYVSPVPLFGSGAEAAAHGRAEIYNPPPEAVKTVVRLNKKLQRV